MKYCSYCGRLLFPRGHADLRLGVVLECPVHGIRGPLTTITVHPSPQSQN